MIFLGIDPGKHGGVAAIEDVGNENPGRILWARPTPLIPAKGGKGAREQYDLDEIRSMLTSVSGGDVHAFVEKLHPMPMQNAAGQAMGGTIANFNRGMACGWHWMLHALWIPYTLVRAQSWQKVMLDGVAGADTKARSIANVARLWSTGVNLMATPRSRTPSDGMADALNLAEYGRRLHYKH